MLNSTALVVGSTSMANNITHVSLHTTGAVTSSANESTAARQPVTWTVNSAGVMSLSNVPFTGGAASGPVVRVGYWTAATGGAYRGGSLLTGDQAFNAAGQYTVSSVTETPTST